MGVIRKIQRMLFIGGRRKDINSDCYIISVPKSGRTWLAMMVGKVLIDHYGIRNGNPAEIRRLGNQKGVPKVQAAHDDNAMWKLPHEFVTDKSRFKGKKVIFLVRDPRDVIVSAYHHKKTRVKPKKMYFFFTKPGHEREVPFTGDIDQFVHSEIGGIDSIIRFLNIWADQRNVPDDFMLTRYEDIKKDPAGELRRCINFIGLTDVPDELIKQAVEFCSFENMRKMEATGAIDSPRLRPGDKNNPESFKTRKGKAGGYLNELTPEQIKFIEDKMRDGLTPFYGYQPCKSNDEC